MPHGVVTLLDEKSDALVRELWHELDVRFGLKGVARVPYPHFSYHVATDYDLPALEKVLTRFSASAAAFSVKTNGLALFVGTSPVVYIPVVRKPALTQLHQWVWGIADAFAIGTHAYYQPDEWMPHITLAQSDVKTNLILDVMKFLNERDLNWQFPVNNLAIIADGQAGSPHDIRLMFPFQA